MLVKVPKPENFELAFFTLSDSTWVGDLGTEAKNGFLDFGFLPYAECSVKKDFSAIGQNLKLLAVTFMLKGTVSRDEFSF